MAHDFLEHFGEEEKVSAQSGGQKTKHTEWEQKKHANKACKR